MTSSTSDSSRGSVGETRIALRVGQAERDRIARLAKASDRTLSGEIRRAIRSYRSNFDFADRTLGDLAIGEKMGPIGEDSQ
jgi:hypothetical protein